MRFELVDNNVERGEGGIRHDHAVADQCGHVHPLRALGAIAHAEDKLQTNEKYAGIPHDDKDVQSDVVAERVDSWVGQAAGDEVEGEVEVGEGEEGEQQRYELVHEFDVQENLAGNRVVGVPDLAEMHKGVYCGKEGAIEPATALRYEFGDGV